MATLTRPLAARGDHATARGGQAKARGGHATARARTAQAGSNYLHFWVAVIITFAVCNLSLLAFLNARGVDVSSATVGLAEAMVFALCLGVQVRRLPPWTLALGLGVVSWIVLTWLIRQRPDLKSVRDLLIPILFLSLGRQLADRVFAQACLRWITALVVAVAVLEVLFTDAYGTLFNTFSFYAGLGSISESAAMFGGQTLTLNGFRPDGIGRTLLPELLGAHRTSSLFLEPVSLGNFAVIVLAWNLSLDWRDRDKPALWMVLAALLLIVLSDSRFGMLMAALLLGYRLLPMPAFRWVAPAFPFLLFGAILAVARLLPLADDTLLGRISGSGQALLDFDAAELMGLSGALQGYGDMGYAYVLSRFGVLQAIALLLVLFLMACPSNRAQRFRAMVVLYFFSSLAISGTSVFALKTAGLMWFLLGALAADPTRQPTRSYQGNP
jgi:putative polymerase